MVTGIAKVCVFAEIFTIFHVDCRGTIEPSQSRALDDGTNAILSTASSASERGRSVFVQVSATGQLAQQTKSSAAVEVAAKSKVTAKDAATEKQSSQKMEDPASIAVETQRVDPAQLAAAAYGNVAHILQSKDQDPEKASNIAQQLANSFPAEAQKISSVKQFTGMDTDDADEAERAVMALVPTKAGR